MRSQSSRTPSQYPGSGSTIPMFVSAGSNMQTATSPRASSRSSPSRSLISTTRVVVSTGTGGPVFPGWSTTAPESSSSAKDSSTVP